MQQAMLLYQCIEAYSLLTVPLLLKYKTSTIWYNSIKGNVLSFLFAVPRLRQLTQALMDEALSLPADMTEVLLPAASLITNLA